MAYIHASKNFIDEKFFEFYSSKYFAPRVVNAQHYARVVVNTMKERAQGKRILVQGNEALQPSEVKYDKGI